MINYFKSPISPITAPSLSHIGYVKLILSVSMYGVDGTVKDRTTIRTLILVFTAIKFEDAPVCLYRSHPVSLFMLFPKLLGLGRLHSHVSASSCCSHAAMNAIVHEGIVQRAHASFVLNLSLWSTETREDWDEQYRTRK